MPGRRLSNRQARSVVRSAISNYIARSERDILPSSISQNDLLPNIPINTRLRDPVTALSEIEDRRKFHPDRYGPRPKTLLRSARFYEKAKPNVFKQIRRQGYKLKSVLNPRSQIRKPGVALRERLGIPQIGFSFPKFVVQCIRRKRRKEVLHAHRKVGRGSGRGVKRYNAFSFVACR